MPGKILIFVVTLVLSQYSSTIKYAVISLTSLFVCLSLVDIDLLS